MASPSKKPSDSSPPPLINPSFNGVLSFPFRPFLTLPKSPPPPSLDDLRRLQDSLLSAADRCFSSLISAASKNPLLRPLLDLRSHYQVVRIGELRTMRGGGLRGAHNFAAILPGDSVAGLVVANGISNFLNLYNTLLVVRLVLTWFPNSPPAIVSPLSTLCDPYLNIFRGIIPPLGGTLDLSPILAFLVLNVFTSTASALPAEMPTSAKGPQSECNLTTSQKKWFRRISGKGSDSEESSY
ncbi:hypothetical protein QJS04_geneDACA013478 [Acorus gramineus]|uniref:Uncharacterized protein n=1 Tax=Acorus gramineus TaxID=55184 RepID=A0AAV9AJD4_ACOGR|nr:hypothetical protein QJS04_geneDACA013478 [Acorus gramineus]